MKTNCEIKKELTIKVQSWETRFYYGGCSRAMVSQVLDKIKPELQKACGVYAWSMQGDPGNYKIIASHKGQKFTESLGKSPRLALQNFYAAKKILADIYGID